MAWANDRIRDLVTRTLLGESNGTPEGMTSVAHVMKNRGLSGAWGPPNGGLTRVITAPKQFSMWNTDDPKLRALAASVNAIPTSDPRYQRAAAIADGVFSDQIPDPTNGATHYHTTSVSPDWSQGATPVATIGGHYFYKLPLSASNTAGTAVTGPSSVGMGAPPLAPLGDAQPQAHAAIADALAAARRMLGKNEVPDHDEIMKYLHDGGQDLDPHKLAWCASFVSATLQKAGLPVPTQVAKGSLVGPGANAGNYLTYGTAVDDPQGIQAGDILVAKNGSHVGFAEGPMREGINGPEVQLLAGNEGDNTGRYKPGSYTNPETGAVANRAQVGMVGERWVPLSNYIVRRAPNTTDTPAPVQQDQGQQTAPPATASAPAAAPAPATAPSPSAGFVGPGSDKYSLVQGMTAGTSRNPQLTTAANWGNLFGGSTPAAPAAQPTPDLAQRVPLDQTPTPPVRPTDPPAAAAPTVPPGAPVNAPPSSPLASIIPNWGADTPYGPRGRGVPDYGDANSVRGGGVSDFPGASRGAPSLGFPAMTNPFGQPPADQTSMPPGSMLASAQNLIRLLFPSNVG